MSEFSTAMNNATKALSDFSEACKGLKYITKKRSKIKAYRQNLSRNQRRELRDAHQLRQECFRIARKAAVEGIGPLGINAVRKLYIKGDVS